MTGKQRLAALLNHQKADRIPWVPLAGVHFGKLKQYSARTVLTDSTSLVESILAAKQVYNPDGLPVYFDIQVEAEALGCDLAWSEESPPSVISHPLQADLRVPEKLLDKNDGRIPLVLETMRETKAHLGGSTALFGLVTGPLTIAYHLRGNPLFFDLIEKPEGLEKLLAFTFRVTQQVAGFYKDAGMDVIGVIEPIASQISPPTFIQLLLKQYQTLFEHIHSLNAFSMLHICGNASQIIEPMCQTGANILSLDEKVHLPDVQTITDRYGVVLQGNIPVTSHLLNGSPDDINQFVVDLIKTLPSPEHLILSPGCDLPWRTPKENMIAAFKAIRN